MQRCIKGRKCRRCRGVAGGAGVHGCSRRSRRCGRRCRRFRGVAEGAGVWAGSGVAGGAGPAPPALQEVQGCGRRCGGYGHAVVTGEQWIITVTMAAY